MAIEGRTHRPVVNHEICQQCRICLKECPAEIIPEYRRDPETVRGYIYGLERWKDRQGIAPCTAACPVGQKARDYIGLLARGQISEALALIRQDNPLPSVCAYICYHPCEEACLRGTWEKPVAIRELKRFAVQYEMDHPSDIQTILQSRMQPARNKVVLVVGSGPAGLACAYDLALAGFKVEILEALNQPGGMLRVGVPTFRLPRRIIDHEITMLRSLGITFSFGIQLGRDTVLENLQAEGNRAVVLALGNHHALPLNIHGEGTKGVSDWLSLLRDFNMGKADKLQGRVLVVGGGNVAVDVARTALRLGADEVLVIYRRSRDEMPASSEEIENAENEGVKFHFQVAPLHIETTQGKVAGLTCIRTSLAEPDESGRRRPEPLNGSDFSISAMHVISAVGQRTELSFMNKTAISSRGTIVIDGKGRIRDYQGIFAAGDVVTGPSSVVQAMASGKAAARNIIRYFNEQQAI
ncbi:MAG TPA: FAD-dependent oxidoreductase [Desulfobacteraceae bacterium]|nr:FAD-dependent oxidoreductase [Desulfobacteraceae bacterium]